ncbi:MAG: hypothetical protein M3Q88_02525 [Pseudomonadota bacterium]|nr:hypothetical protein [Pseudomonadota bacterium]
MSVLMKLLTGAAGLAAAVGFASPAAAQYYPGYGYNNGGGIVGAIINGVIGGGNRGYGYGNYGSGNDRYAVSQCSRAVEARLGGGYRGNTGGYGYNNYGGGARVVGITGVERKNSGIRVRGVATSGARGGYGYNGGYANNGADLSFSCKVSYRGQITDIDLDRRHASYGYNQGYYRGY